FVQTMIYNSPMKEQIDHDTDGLVSTTWEMEDNHQVRKNHAFIQEDLDYLLSGNTCFALKFVGQEGLELTDAIAASFQTQDASGSGE
ncbi:MAG: hypothetical protein J6D18_04015, partial [Erysipelotrichaceae bacterium]|nr:hypothetical protein [Erysipelotrichaceae bacterium]